MLLDHCMSNLLGSLCPSGAGPTLSTSIMGYLLDMTLLVVASRTFRKYMCPPSSVTCELHCYVTWVERIDKSTTRSNTGLSFKLVEIVSSSTLFLSDDRSSLSPTLF